MVEQSEQQPIIDKNQIKQQTSTNFFKKFWHFIWFDSDNKAKRLKTDQASLQQLQKQRQVQERASGLVDQHLLKSGQATLGQSALKAGLLKRLNQEPPSTPLRTSPSTPPAIEVPAIPKSGFMPAPPAKSLVKNPLAPLKTSKAEPRPTIASPMPLSESDLNRQKAKMQKRFVAEREKYQNQQIRQGIEGRYWHSHNIVRADLIKEQATLFFSWQGKILVLILALGLTFLIVGIIYGALLVWESNKLQANKYIFDNLANVNEKIAAEEKYTAEILSFNEKLMLVDYLLDNHLYWSNFFKFLEKNTITDVYFEGFTGDTAGQYSLPAVARDFRAVYLQLKLLQQQNQVLLADTESAKTLKQQEQELELESRGGYPPAGEAALSDKIRFILNLTINRNLFLR